MTTEQVESTPENVTNVTLSPPGDVAQAENPPHQAETVPATSDGLIPLFLTNQTVDLFSLKDVMLGSGPPHIAIPKVNLVADMFSRAAISDFAPAKKQIQNFPDAELLLVYDPEWAHGQNFFLLVTPEAIQTYLTSLQPKAHEGPKAADIAEVAVKSKPVSKTWVSLGSEEEIEWENLRPAREKLAFKFSKRLKEFGAPVAFGDAVLKQIVEFKSVSVADEAAAHQSESSAPAVKYVSRTLQTKGIQAVPQIVNTSCQTNWNRPQNAAMQYEPRVLSEKETEAALDSFELEEFLHSSCSQLETALRFNLVANIFQDNYKDLGDEDVVYERSALTGLQELQSFTSIRRSKDKSISSIDWHPTLRGVLAASFARKSTFNEKVEITSIPQEDQSCILVWNMKDPIHPQLLLELPDDIVCIKFNPEEPHILAGGCLNGQIVLWNLSEYSDYLRGKKTVPKFSADTSSPGASAGAAGAKQQPAVTAVRGEFGASKEVVELPHVTYCVTSSIEHGHKEPVTDIAWLPKATELKGQNGDIALGSEMGHMQLASVSLDGNVYFWDMRQKKELKSLDLTWRPFFRAPMLYPDNINAYGLTKLSLHLFPGSKDAPARLGTANLASRKAAANKVEPSVSTKFFAATEEGSVLIGDWAGDKATASAEEKASTRVVKSFAEHAGPVTDLQRSPFFPEIVCSIGGWSFAVWSEDVEFGPLLESVPAAHSLTCSAWSPTRPGVLYIGRSDGAIEIWDFTASSFAPVQVHSVGSAPISSLSIKCSSVLVPNSDSLGKSGPVPSMKAVVKQTIAVGTDNSSLHVLDIPPHLAKASKLEKKIVKAFFERQQQYLTLVQERLAQRSREKTVFLEQQLKINQSGTGEMATNRPKSGSAKHTSEVQDAESAETTHQSVTSSAANPQKNGDDKKAEELDQALAREREFEESYKQLEFQFLESMSLTVQ